MTEKFDFEKALEAMKNGKPITGKDSVISPLKKQLIESALEAELDTHLARAVDYCKIWIKCGCPSLSWQPI